MNFNLSLWTAEHTHTYTQQYIAHTHTRRGKVCAPIRPGQLVEHFVRVVRPKGTTFFFQRWKLTFFPRVYVSVSVCVCGKYSAILRVGLKRFYELEREWTGRDFIEMEYLIDKW